MRATQKRESAEIHVGQGKEVLARVRELLICLLIVLPYAISLLSVNVIRPDQIAWLKGDSATYYIGWAMLRLAGALHWPLTYTQALGYPIGESISLLDPIPIVALVLRPVSSILPRAFQYLGLYSILCMALQLYFGVRLLRALVPGQRTVAWLGGILFLIAPPFTYRFGGHFALASHWLILAALLVYVRATAGEYSFKDLVWRSAVLITCAAGVNPYLGGIVLAVTVAMCASGLFAGRMTLRPASFLVFTSLFWFVICSGAFGLIGSSNKDFTGAGYRYFSMNLLAPINPWPPGSAILPSLSTFTTGQYEGYNYLGAGTLGLLVLGSLLMLGRRPRIRYIDMLKWSPILICAIGFTLMALSTLVSSGARMIIDLDSNQRLTPYLATFRASGRLFWLAYYLLTAGAVTSVVRLIKDVRYCSLALGAALALQVYDTRPVRQYVRSALAPTPPTAQLSSSVWQTLRREHRNLAVFPAWQCNSDTPGGADGFRIFGILAAEQGLTINSYYAARYRQDSLKFHCAASVEEVSKVGLKLGTAYVVSPFIAERIAKSPSGPNHCYRVDGFTLCTLSELTGQRHWLPEDNEKSVPAIPLGTGELTAREAGHFLTGWNALEPGVGAWSINREAVLAYRDAPKNSKSLRLTLLAVSGRNPVGFTLVYDRGHMDGIVPTANPPNIKMFTVRLPIEIGSALHKITIITKGPRSPADQGYNADPREMGIGVHSLSADACIPSSVIDFSQALGTDPICMIKSPDKVSDSHAAESMGATAQVPVAPLGAGILTVNESGLLVGGWTTLVPGFGAWSISQEAMIAYRAPARPAKSLRFTMLGVTGRNPISFAIIYEKGRIDGILPAESVPKIQLFTVRLPMPSGTGVHKVTIVNNQLRSPSDQRYNADPRLMGVGIRAIAADSCAPSSRITFQTSETLDPVCVLN
jgi:Family of unknown function (DUF6311)